jgi:DNA-binding response OmpR family regulator
MKEKITVIDDDMDLRNLLGLALEMDGFDVTFSNGVEFMNSFNETSVSGFYIIDVNLGGISGPEICKYLKSFQAIHNSYVILISANPELHQFADESAADGYLLKPFSQKELLTKIKSYKRDTIL